MSGDLLNPPDGEVAHAIAAVGNGQVALNLSTRLDDDETVTIVGVEMARLEAARWALRLLREAVRR